MKGFVGHACNEVVIDGHWVSVDANLGITEILPFYLHVGRGTNALALFGESMGKMSFELVEAELVR